MKPQPLIYDLSFEELSVILKEWSEPSFRARQIWQGIYQQLWATPEDFSNLPRSLRHKLQENLSFQALTPVNVLVSDDHNTVKTLLRLADGLTIEAVLMRYTRRNTLCISTQAGCAMGCTFCATGQMGFKRHLTSGEIVEQVLYYARMLKQEDQHVTNIVIMGMGEPFHNYNATLEAINRLHDPQGFNLGERHFTISTVGLVPEIRKFTQEARQINLAVSLHAANDELRSSMLPINKTYPLAELIDACREYVDKTRRRITFEWALIQNVNDARSDAKALAALLKGLLCHVNVIPLNPTRQFAGKATPRERAQAFCQELETRGIPCTIRMRRGIEIQAGCGQLAARPNKNTEN